MRVFWMNKQQKYSWASLNLGGERATEPIVVDFGNDGKAEVIFCSWGTNAGGGTGHLWIVNYQGVVLSKVALPPPTAGSGSYNGALAAPTIGNIDGDPDLEVVIQTISSGIVAYDIPNSAGARIIWGTGRLNYGRNPDEWAWATARCTTCKTNCVNACGTQACKNACPTTCNNNRGCY